MPLLSIITINYNNASGLRKTIESVVNQTSRDFEYIIIDGGSTDDSLNVIRSFTNIPQAVYTTMDHLLDSVTVYPSHLPISYWVSETDSGIYQAMNKGILVAKGEYCQFLNSGDWLASPNVIEKMLTSFTDCSIYYGNMLKLMPKGRIYRDTCNEGKITMLNFYQGTLNHSPTFIKRSMFEKFGLYDETLCIVSDWKWFLIAIGLNNEPLKYTNIDVAYFDMNGISNTHRNQEKQERRKVLVELLPANILKDYDSHWREIDQMIRIKRNKIFYWLFNLIERVIFKYEKTTRLLIS